MMVVHESVQNVYTHACLLLCFAFLIFPSLPTTLFVMLPCSSATCPCYKAERGDNPKPVGICLQPHRSNWQGCDLAKDWLKEKAQQMKAQQKTMCTKIPDSSKACLIFQTLTSHDTKYLPLVWIYFP